MEEVLVWVMERSDDQTQLILGTVGEKGVIFRSVTYPNKPHRDSFYATNHERAKEILLDFTRTSEENGYLMAMTPTVLRVPGPAINELLPIWVEQELVNVVATRMKMQRVAEIRRKQATGRPS